MKSPCLSSQSNNDSSSIPSVFLIGQQKKPCYISATRPMCARQQQSSPLSRLISYLTTHFYHCKKCDTEYGRSPDLKLREVNQDILSSFAFSETAVNRFSNGLQRRCAGMNHHLLQWVVSRPGIAPGFHVRRGYKYAHHTPLLF